MKAPTGAFPPNKSAGLSARSCVTSQVHEVILWAIFFFCPSTAPSQCFSQASGASRSQHRLSSFLLTKDGSRGCNAVGCANTNIHRPTNTRNSFSAPEAVLSEVELRSAQHPQIPRFFANFSRNLANAPLPPESFRTCFVCELELIQTQMAQKPMLRAEVGMRVRCANKASAE